MLAVANMVGVARVIHMQVRVVSRGNAVLATWLCNQWLVVVEVEVVMGVVLVVVVVMVVVVAVVVALVEGQAVCRRWAVAWARGHVGVWACVVVVVWCW